MINCGNCEQGFNPEGSRWLCPHCGWKNSCCEGEPQPQQHARDTAQEVSDAR